MKLYLFIFSFVFSVLLTVPFSNSAQAIEGVISGGQSTAADFLSTRPTSVRRSRSLIQPSFPKLSFGQHNKYFTDIIKLQYQISLLQTLIERQKQDQEIQKSFSEMGIPYMPSAPKRTMCEELPLNDLCAMFYMDLYEGQKASNLASKSDDPNATLQDIIDSMPSEGKKSTGKTAASTGQEQPFGAVKQEEKKKQFNPAYKWADISCVKGVCRATLVKDSKERVTDYTGSDLAGEDIIVGDISFNNVVLVNKEGERKRLRPAASPEQGGVKSPLLGVASIDASAVKELQESGRSFNPNDPFGEPSGDDSFDDDVDVDVLLDELTEEDSISDILILGQ